MIGGDADVVGRLDPIFAALAPSVDAAPRTPGRSGPADARRARLPALRTERRRPLRQDGAQRNRVRDHGRVRGGAEHPPPRQRRQGDSAPSTPRPRRCRSPSSTSTTSTSRDIAEVWRRGSVIASWLLDLTAAALARRPRAGRVHRSRLRLGRGSLDAQGRHRRERAGADPRRRAISERFASRGEDEFADRLLSAMRFEFGGHEEKH